MIYLYYLLVKGIAEPVAFTKIEFIMIYNATKSIKNFNGYD